MLFIRCNLKRNNFKNYLMEFPNYISLFIFSFYMMLASPILLDISNYFNVSPENMNFIITFFLIGEAAGMLALIFLNRKFSSINVVIWVYILLIPVLIGLILATSLIFFYVLYFISGFLLGIIFMNANISMLEGGVKNKDSVINLGHGFFAIGALASPFFASSLVNRQINWKLIYLAVIVLVLISLISYLFKNKRKRAKTGLEKEKRVISMKGLFKNKNKNIYMILTVILMLFYVMSEVTVFSWAPTFFRVEKLFDLYSASFIVSVFWIGILVGRLSVSFLSYKFKAGALLIALSIISITGLMLAIFPIRQEINFIGAGLTGLGFSGIPPLLISSAGRIFGSGKDVALTILFVVGITSGSLIPLLIRSIANYSFFLSMAIAIMFMVVFAIFVIIRKYYRKTLKKS
ncbi:MAG: MFS transporter [Candidatus Humimicrobiaceae bacterium]